MVLSWSFIVLRSALRALKESVDVAKSVAVARVVFSLVVLCVRLGLADG